MDMIKREKERKSLQEVAEISNWGPTKDEALKIGITSHPPKAVALALVIFCPRRYKKKSFCIMNIIYRLSHG